MKKLESGNYNIRYTDDCGCSIDWDIVDEGVQPDISSDACYESNLLSVDGEDIAEYIRYDGLKMLTDTIDRDDIPDRIIDEMRLSDMCEQGDSGNGETHDNNLRNTLIDWLSERVDEGYKLMRDNERGFANEFTVLLVSPGADADEIDEDWDTLTPEAWAREYLYSGDAATQAYNGCKVI
jgi:hypothetical protein